LGINDETVIGKYASYFMTSYLIGAVLGTFFWPAMDKIFLKKYLVLAGIGG